MGIWVLPTANSLDVIKQVREALPAIQQQLPAGMKLGIPYDSTEYIQDAINEVLHTLTETLLIVVVVIFLFLGSFRSVLIPVVAIPISLIGAVFLMLVVGFTHQPAHAAGHRALGRAGGRRRHRHRGKRRAASARWASRRSRPRCRAARELVGPIIAMTITLAAVYAPIGIQGGLTGALFREFAFTLAGAVVVSGIVALTLSPMMGSKLLRAGDTATGLRRVHQPPLRRACAARYTPSARRDTLKYRPVALTLWAIVAVLMRSVLHVLAARTRADGRSGRRLRHHPGCAQRHHRSDEPVHRAGLRRLSTRSRRARARSRSRTPNGGFGGMVTKPWSQRKKTDAAIAGRVRWTAVEDCRRSRDPTDSRRRCPAAATSPSTSSSPQRPSRSNSVEFANQLVQKAMASGMFIFADTDLKFDQPQTEVVFDRDKLRSQGVNLSQAGSDLVDDAGRQLRQPLQHSGPQLQGHPAGEARRAAHRRPAVADLRQRIRRTNWCSCPLSRP